MKQDTRGLCPRTAGRMVSAGDGLGGLGYPMSGEQGVPVRQSFSVSAGSDRRL